MRYHHDSTAFSHNIYGITYTCDHPVYNRATLYKKGDLGLCVIQQRYDAKTKKTWWTEIDPWLTDELYLNNNFNEYFKRYAKISTNGFYPTVTIRQIMWALKIKPLKREIWETVFDKSPV